jgi:hypothetical protein
VDGRLQPVRREQVLVLNLLFFVESWYFART